MSLKPKKFDLHLIYNCPQCGSDHWYSPNEIKSRPVLICCNTVYPIKPMKKATVNINYEGVEKPKPKPSIIKIPDKAIRILAGYGFSTEEIKQFKAKSSDAGEFIKNFLAAQNEI